MSRYAMAHRQRKWGRLRKPAKGKKQAHPGRAIQSNSQAGSQMREQSQHDLMARRPVDL